MIKTLILMALVGFTTPTVEDFYNSTINRSVVIGHYRTTYGLVFKPVSRGVAPNDVVERRYRSSNFLTVTTFGKGGKRVRQRIFEKVPGTP